jgi:hypothetical protein
MGISIAAVGSCLRPAQNPRLQVSGPKRDGVKESGAKHNKANCVFLYTRGRTDFRFERGKFEPSPPLYISFSIKTNQPRIYFKYIKALGLSR